MDTEVMKLNKYLYVNCKIMGNWKNNLNIMTIYQNNNYSVLENYILYLYNKYQVILFVMFKKNICLL
jgi:hypothetical protein